MGGCLTQFADNKFHQISYLDNKNSNIKIQHINDLTFFYIPYFESIVSDLNKIFQQKKWSYEKEYIQKCLQYLTFFQDRIKLAIQYPSILQKQDNLFLIDIPERPKIPISKKIQFPQHYQDRKPPDLNLSNKLVIEIQQGEIALNPNQKQINNFQAMIEIEFQGKIIQRINSQQQYENKQTNKKDHDGKFSNIEPIFLNWNQIYEQFLHQLDSQTLYDYSFTIKLFCNYEDKSQTQLGDNTQFSFSELIKQNVQDKFLKIRIKDDLKTIAKIQIRFQLIHNYKILLLDLERDVDINISMIMNMLLNIQERQNDYLNRYTFADVQHFLDNFAESKFFGELGGNQSETKSQSSYYSEVVSQKTYFPESKIQSQNSSYQAII